MLTKHWFFGIITTLASVGMARADALSWTSKQGTLEKPEFSNQQATYRVASAGGLNCTFKLSHVTTVPNKFSYSKWEINRWGDPAGALTPPGSWQVVSNASNGIGLALWGYWGNFGGALVNGDTTSYQLSLDFEQPVKNLVLPLNGINALVDSNGNNAVDSVTVASFLDGTAQASPTYTNKGQSIIRTGDNLKGDFSKPMGQDTGRANTSNDGSVTVTFPHTLNRVMLTIVSEARHPTPSLLQDAQQNWSLSLGDLNFEPAAVGTRSQINWLPRRGTLDKPGYDKAPASYQATSQDGAATVTLNLAHVSTTGDKFSYSKWEIDRWGDPSGLFTPPGSWQVVSNGANDVVLGLWGYWGTDGSAGAPALVQGDKTTYRLTMTFNKPVTDLRFPLNGINALLSGGFNSFDTMTVTSFLGTAAQPAPTFTDKGPGMTQSGNVLTGNYAVQIGGGFQNVTDEGSVSLRFPGAVDKVVLTLVNEAKHPTPAQFQAGMQNWSFSIGDMSFLPGVSTQVLWPPRQGQLTKPGYTSAPATYQAASADNGVTATFNIQHLGTTANKFSYSQWEINRWGDPNGVILPTGSWQVVSNSTNDIVFAIWGYWGTDNSAGAPPVVIGDQTSYRLTISFNKTVDSLSFFMNGINALLKPESGYNSQDIITVQSFLGTTTQANPAFSQAGNAFTIAGNVLTGNFANQINNGFSGQHVSDQGSVKLSFPQPVDKVQITLVNRADHPTPASFMNGQQSYSFSLGNLSFRYGQGSGGTPRLGELPTETTPLGEPIRFVRAEDGQWALRIEGDSEGNFDLSRLQSSSDMREWKTINVQPRSLRESSEGLLWIPDISLPQRFFRWRK